MRKFRLLNSVIALISVFTLITAFTPVAEADPYSSISGSAGVNGSTTSTSYNLSGGSATLQLSDGSSTNVSGTVSSVTVTFASSTSVNLSSSLTLTFGSGSATFSFTNPATFSNTTSGSPYGYNITDQLTLTSNTTGDTLVSGGWSLLIAGTGVSIGSSNFTHDSTGAASFSLQANSPPATVPEPASLALWGVVGLVGAWYGRRKLQRTVAL